MDGFRFSLADKTSLIENHDDFFLLSCPPIKIMRVNKPLYLLLKIIQNGLELPVYSSQNQALDGDDILTIMFTLVSKGYLKLEKIAAMEHYPAVSVIVPVRDQPEDLTGCLQSLANLDYPEDRLEIIIVDDGSKKEISRFIDFPEVKVIRHDKPKGPAASRNTGAESARGDILAFLDTDCVARENWLRELIPFFRIPKMGAVGGYVDSYYKKSYLDRYEEESSPLNMGKRLILEAAGRSTFYVPTANVLVLRDTFVAIGGFKAEMHVGEDVDFCWRLKDRGYSLLYVPFGSIAHKHRNQLSKMLMRRMDYGTSEASLYRTHKDKRKVILFSVFSGLSFLALILSILLMNPYPVALIPLLLGADLWRKTLIMKKFNVPNLFRQAVFSVFRSHFSFYYYIFFHLVRYYLILLLVLGFLLHPIWLISALGIACISIIDYYVKKARLSYPVFLYFYILEHLSYQIGVFSGCSKAGYFGSYIVYFQIV